MIGILIVSHGKLAEGFQDAIELIIGKQENLSTISLEVEDSIDNLPDRIEEKIKSFEMNDGVIIFVDLFGASPFNGAARVAHNLKSSSISVIAGVNLGMVLEVIVNRESKNIEELSSIAISAGNQAIKSLNEMMRRN